MIIVRPSERLIAEIEIAKIPRGALLNLRDELRALLPDGARMETLRENLYVVLTERVQQVHLERAVDLLRRHLKLSTWRHQPLGC